MNLRSPMKLFALLALALSLAGCAEPEIDDEGCSPTTSAARITLTAAPATLAPDAEAVVVRGTAMIESGIAIRRVTVDGVDATATSFNFGGWSAQLPASAIRPRVKDPMVDETIDVAVTAVDACESPPAKADASILVDAP